jgi:adenylate kinase family enzyme
MRKLPCNRIHIFGASGAGITTLGRGLAGMFAIPHHDTDDYYWLPTNPPYRHIRREEDRLRLMQEIFLQRPAWILSGSLTGWGDALIPFFDAAIFITTPTRIRLERLRSREALRYGVQSKEQIEQTEAFLEWAGAYDAGDETMRSFACHAKWIKKIKAPVINLDGREPRDVLLQDAYRQVMAARKIISPNRRWGNS